MDHVVEKKPVTFSDFLRAKFKGILDPIAKFLNKLGLMPNTITIFGLLLTAFGAVLLGLGHITWGGLVILISGPIDALDGTMARLRGMPSAFGAFVDSVTDRYSELIILLGLLVHFLRQGDALSVVLVFLAAAGSVMVSYTKARAEALGYEARVGLLTRVERYLVIAPLCLFNLPHIALWILAIFANFTALQRIYAVRVQAKAQGHVLVPEKKPKK